MGLFTILSILFSLILISLAQSPPYPVWPNVFSQSFTLNITNVGDIKTGKYWYDYNRRTQRYDFQGITPSSSINKDKKVYIILPQQQLCCYLGLEIEVNPPDWPMKLTFVDQRQISHQTYNFWQNQLIPCFQYYSQKSQKNIMRRIKTNCDEYFDFWVNTYSQDPIKQSVFALPSYCKSQCSFGQLGQQAKFHLSMMRKMKKMRFSNLKKE